MAPSYWDKFTNHFPFILFHLTLRFSLLRIVCLTTFPMFIASVVQKAFMSFLTYFSLVVFLHHFATTLGPRFSLPGGLDLALVLAEVPLYNPGLEAINRWSTKLTVFTGVLAWTTTISVAILAVLRIAEALKKGWSFLWKRYDITAPEYRHAWSGESKTSGGDANLHGRHNTKILTPNDVLFGRSIWKSQFLGETYWIIISRGVFAAVLIVLISLFTLFLVVLEPVRETALTPVKESRTVGFPWDFKTTGVQRWNVVVAKPTNRSLKAVPFDPAIRVEWMRVNNSKIDCPADDVNRLWPRKSEMVALDLMAYRCALQPVDQGTYPDILVTVNFTMLNITADLAARTRWNSVQVFLGRIQSPFEVVRRTPSTSLIPGVNLIGFGQRQLRQQFSDPTMSAFGLFDSFRTFITFEMVHVWHDPRADTSPLIIRAPDVSTLRIITPYNFAEWKIVQQSRDKSVLRGLASVGGLWTFLGGIFTILFGTSIMRIIFGSKPISVFGLTRSVIGDKIKDACRTEYPRIESDLNVQPADKGLIAFMADHVVDFDFLLKDSAGHSSSHESVPPLNVDEGKNENSDTIPLLPVTNDTTPP